MRFLALIPARNEAPTLARVVGELRASWAEADILVVDDGSVDETQTIVRQLDVRWLTLRQALGLGGAMRAGLRYAAELGHDLVVRLDGDGQHRPDQIPRLIEPIVRDEADAVLGSRFCHGGARPLSVLGFSQWALGRCLGLLTRQPVTDPTSGFWAFGSRAVSLLSRHHPTGYPEPELLLFLSRNRLRVREVPVEIRERLAGRTTLTPARIGHALARVLLAMVVVPLRAAVERTEP